MQCRLTTALTSVFQWGNNKYQCMQIAMRHLTLGKSACYDYNTKDTKECPYLQFLYSYSSNVSAWNYWTCIVMQMQWPHDPQELNTSFQDAKPYIRWVLGKVRTFSTHYFWHNIKNIFCNIHRSFEFSYMWSTDLMAAITRPQRLDDMVLHQL